jgi:excinuclease UvrABC ATPase subunit
MPIERTRRGVAYSNTFEGLIRGLERLYVNKAEDEVPEVRRGAYKRYLVRTDCDVRGGTRLKPDVLAARLRGRNISGLAALELGDLDAFWRVWATTSPTPRSPGCTASCGT